MSGAAGDAVARDAVVRTALGRVRGRWAATRAGAPYAKFVGLRYAAPPVGALRFRPPQPLKPWTGTEDALEEGSICFQDYFLSGVMVGSEDCLYLNVYTLELSATSSPKSVMVWIHGGGFTAGSGNADVYGPDYFVDAGVVFVSINYRLGVLGFLSLNNRDIPGNMGLKDQVAALQWVKENIYSFGGDPKNITIFGESAGGASVHYHMLSPLSKGLFHKAIAQSGSALNPWAFSSDNRRRAFLLGQLLGCNTTDEKVLMDCLMETDVETLVKNASRLFSKDENLIGLKFPFLPTAEPPGRGSFLSEHPLTALRAGRFHCIPLLAGTTSHEGIICLKALRASKSGWSVLNSDFENQLPSSLISLTELSTKVKELYFNNKPFSEDNIEQFINFQTDFNFADGVYRMVNQTAALSSNPVYLYLFKFDGNLGLFKQFLNLSDVKGASHGDEIGYLFKFSVIDVDVEPGSLEQKTLCRMVKLWTNFAKTGNPTPCVDQDIPVLWRQFTCREPWLYSIDENLSTEKLTFTKYRKFWDSLYQHKL